MAHHLPELRLRAPVYACDLEIDHANEPDQIVTLTYKKRILKLKVINLELPSGRTLEEINDEAV